MCCGAVRGKNRPQACACAVTDKRRPSHGHDIHVLITSMACMPMHATCPSFSMLSSYISLSLLCITHECTEVRQETTPTMIRLLSGMAPPGREQRRGACSAPQQIRACLVACVAPGSHPACKSQHVWFPVWRPQPGPIDAKEGLSSRLRGTQVSGVSLVQAQLVQIGCTRNFQGGRGRRALPERTHAGD